MRGMGNYVLDENGNPILCESLEDWCKFYQDSDRRIVERTKVGDATVSTVFLAIDHNFGGEGPPVLWETTIFGGAHDQEEQWRYSSLEEAKAGHAMAVELEKGRQA